MDMRGNNRKGIALAVSLFAIVIIGAMVAGGFFMSMQDFETGRNTLVQARSVSAAEFGQNEALRQWWNMGATGLAVGETTAGKSFTSEGGGTSTVRITRLQQTLFSVVSDGGAGYSTRETDARRRTGLLIKLQVPVIDMLGALTARGNTRLGGSSFIDGNDYAPPAMSCGPTEPAKPGLSINDSTKVTYTGCNNQTCLAGEPKIDENPKAGEDDTYFKYGDIGWDDLVAKANKVVSGTLTGVGPVAVGGVCQTSNLLNWGDPLNGGACKNYFPIVYAPGSLSISGGFGQGILLVNGDLEVQGGHQFYGPVIVKGKLRTTGTGGHFNGGVMAANVDLDQNVVLGDAVIRYSSCAVLNALLGIALPKRVADRAWADLY